MGVNNDVKMERGPMIFTSDVSLPKDDKSASEVNKSQLGNWQDYEGTTMLTMLQRKEGLKSNGQLMQSGQLSLLVTPSGRLM